ncbi:MAG: hypothetical protein ACLF0P_09700 [Thermoanaerobaculia bacterium]
MLLLVPAGPVLGQETGGEAAQARPLSKLQVHAFLNQAWGKTDGNQVEGLTEDGNSDYRTLALQFRYAITLDDIVVVQLQNEVRGDSLLDDVRNEIEVDWAFYEHRFNESTGVRLGRVRMPLGIYNEIRDVGTLLPFFEPPEGIYSDGLFTQESLDGVAFYRHLQPAEGWRLTVDGYLGEWERDLVFPTDDAPDFSRADDGAGLQLWLETPVNGLRFGLGGLRYKVSGSSINLNEEDDWNLLLASVDANFDRWTARAEFMDASYELFFDPIAIDDGGYTGYYGQLGYRVTDRWTVWAQYDVADVELAGSRFPSHEFDLVEDLALSLTFAPRSEILFKGEVHSMEGFVGFFPELNVLVDPPAKTDYGLLSVSVAF